jgi:hypothetical protein
MKRTRQKHNAPIGATVDRGSGLRHMVGYERDDGARTAIARSKESGARGITRSRRGDGQAGLGNVGHHGLAGASSPRSLARCRSVETR